LVLTINRDGMEQTLSVKLGTSPDQRIASEVTNKLGLEVSDLTAELAARLGYINEKGVVITKVAPGSVSEQAGARPGNLIVSVGKQQVTTVEEFKQAMQQTAATSKTVRLLLRQGPAYRFIVLPLDSK
jgi:serine protease Do